MFREMGGMVVCREMGGMVVCMVVFWLFFKNGWHGCFLKWVACLFSWLTLSDLGNGSATLIGTPSNDNVGANDVTLIVVDNDNVQAEQHFTITVANINDEPVITIDNTLTVDEDGNQTLSFSYTDIDKDTVTATEKTAPEHGSLVITAGDILYRPIANYNGMDSFVVTLTDGQGFSIDKTINVTISSINDKPVITIDSTLTVDEDGNKTLAFSYTDIDNDTVTVTEQTKPEHGSLTITANDILYTPIANYNGVDSFVVTLTDGQGFSTDKTVNVTVASVNDIPIAQDDQFSFAQTATNQYMLAVLDNDSDIDTDSLTITGASAAIGSVSIVENQLLYQAEQGFIGTVNLEYLVDDGQQGKDKAYVSLTINGALPESAPEITLPNDIEVKASGLFTKAKLGVATAIDYLGNPVATSLVDGKTMFSPGAHQVYWQAIDSKGNKTVSAQNVLIHPLVSISKDQTVAEGNKVELKVMLNGNSPGYPVVVPFSVSGSAVSGEDHDLVAGEVSIDSSNEALINFNVFTDNEFDESETIRILLSDTVNVSPQASQIITISEGNLSPEVALLVEQGQQQRFLLTRDGGEVNIRAQVSDANELDTHYYQWASSNDALQSLLSNKDAAAISIALDTLTEGIYPISVTVTDNGNPVKSTRAEVYLEVITALPVLTAADSDGDLIPDSQEGYGDQDKDGIPDYQDAITACNVTPEKVSQQLSFLVEGDAGVCLRKGAASAGNESGGSLLNEQDLANSVGNDDDAINVGGIFDYIAYGLPQAGQKYYIVLPQLLPIPADAVYRKYSKTAGWMEYVKNANNAVFSSPGHRGYCPPPQDASWKLGLNEGDWCVQLMINDGGPNDNDGLANGTIVDPSGVSVYRNGNNMPTAQNTTQSVLWNSLLIIDVTNMISDEDGDSLTISNVSADFGEVSISGLQISYMPATDFVGNDTLVYSISDGNGGTASGTVTVTVKAYQPVVVDNKSKSGGAMSIWMLLLTPVFIIRKKRGFIALLLLVNAISLPAKADWGTAVNYGQTKADISNDELNQQLANLGADAQVTSLDDKGQGWGVDAIYRFEEGVLEHWQLIVGYQDLGGFDATINGQAIYPDEFQQLVSEVQPQSADGWGASVGYQFMLTERFFVQGHLGQFNWKSKSAAQLRNDSASSTHVNDSGHDLFYGAELGYKWLDDMEVSLLYDHYSLDKNDIEFLGVGLKYYY